MNFCADLGKNIIIIENSIRPGDSGEDPLTLANFCDFSLNFPLATLVFSLKFTGRHPKKKDNNFVLAAYGGGSRKFKIFTEKSGDFYGILKEFNVNDNSRFRRTFS